MPLPRVAYGVVISERRPGIRPCLFLVARALIPYFCACSVAGVFARALPPLPRPGKYQTALPLPTSPAARKAGRGAKQKTKKA